MGRAAGKASKHFKKVETNAGGDGRKQTDQQCLCCGNNYLNISGTRMQFHLTWSVELKGTKAVKTIKDCAFNSACATPAKVRAILLDLLGYVPPELAHKAGGEATAPPSAPGQAGFSLGPQQTLEAGFEVSVCEEHNRRFTKGTLSSGVCHYACIVCSHAKPRLTTTRPPPSHHSRQPLPSHHSD